MTNVESPAPHVSQSTEHVLGLLGEQATLYASLERLAVNQRSLVAGDDAAALLALLADRQRLSQRLAQIAGALAPIRQAWTTFRQSLAPPQRREAERLLEECRDRLLRIIQSDDEDARILSGRKQAVAGASKSTHAIGQAIRAYRTSGAIAGRINCVDEDQ